MKRVLSKFTSLKAPLGGVIFETIPVTGEVKKYSYLIWRVKRGVDGRLYIGVKLRPDTYEGPEGALRNYMNFDLESAEKVRANLDTCIAEYRRLQGNQERSAR